MNIEKLKRFESLFLMRYPEGFFSPDMQAMSKKHKLEKLFAMAQASFAPEAFEDSETVTSDLIKLVSASSLVSLFEKPKLRDGIHAMTYEERRQLSEALKELLHGNEAMGFEEFVECLHSKRLANWTIVSTCLAYYRPESEMFIKPNTVKAVLKALEIEDIKYQTFPTYAFYKAYRAYVNEVKTYIDPSIYPNNPALSGFLMMFASEEGYL